MSQTLDLFAHYGDSDAKEAIQPFQRDLINLFEKSLTGRYFRTVERLSVFLRVSGSIRGFEGEGPQRLKFLRRDHVITVDLVIPQSRWREVKRSEIHKILYLGVKDCVELLIQRAKKEGELLDESNLVSDFQQAMDMFNRASEDTAKPNDNS
jgi:hypothetical protein